MRQAHIRHDEILSGILHATRRHGVTWLANVLLIGGAILVSVFPLTAVQAPVFAAFLVGHLCLCVHATCRRDLPLLVLNAFLSAIDAYAIAVRL